MRSLIQYLTDKVQGAPGVTLMIGAGNGAELPALRRLHSGRLILVEAHPGQAEVLAQRIDPTRGEEVWPLAITASAAAEATLQVMNNPRHNSLKAPGDLLEHLPNLRVINEVVVDARALDEVIEGLQLDDGGNNLLILDAPGQTLDLLNATAREQLQSFSRIIARCGVVPLYSDDGNREDCVAALEALGFDVELDDDEAIYPTSTFLLHRDEARVKLQHLKEEIQQLRTAHAAQVQLVEKHDEQIETATKAHAEALALAQQHAATEVQKLSDDHQAQATKLTHERDEQAQLAVQFKAERDKYSQQLAEQQKLAEDRKTQLQKQLDQSLESDAAANHELAETRRTLSLSVRLQTLRENDLKDLQERYATVLKEKARQQELLTKLSERLTTASNYFHQLAAHEGAPTSSNRKIRKNKDASQLTPKKRHSKHIEQGS